jgi:hypothetical protein
MEFQMVRLQGADFSVLPLAHTRHLSGPLVYKWSEALGLGMNAVFAHYRPSRSQRLDLETVLRHQYRPPLNDQSLPPRTPARPTLAEVLAYPVEAGGNALASAYARHRGPVENALAVARRYPSPGNALAREGLGLLPRR